MRNRIPLLTGLAAVSLASLLVGCDPKKDTPATSGGGSAMQSGNTSTTNATPSTNASAMAAFDKPRKADAAAPLTVKVITNGNSPFWDSMGIGLAKGKEEAKLATADWNAPNSSDNNSQKTTFEQAVTTNPDGIAISVIDPAAFAPTIDAAIDKGIPVITFDSDAPTSQRLVYIGTNNYEAGKQAGEAAVKLFPNGGKLMAFVGNMSADNAKQRYQGFVDATKDHNITMLAEPLEDNKDAGSAQSNATNALTKYSGQITGLVGLYSYNGPAIVSAVQKANLIGKVKIICFDAEPKTIENLGKKLVDITVVQKPYEFGRLSALLLAEINRKGLTQAMQDMKPQLEAEGMKVDTDKRIIDTGVQIVTPDTSAKFLEDLNAKGLKSS